MQHRRYSDIHPPQFALYTSEEPRAHMFTAAAWMFKMTGDKSYQQSAQAYHAQARHFPHAALLYARC